MRPPPAATRPPARPACAAASAPMQGSGRRRPRCTPEKCTNLTKVTKTQKYAAAHVCEQQSHRVHQVLQALATDQSDYPGWTLQDETKSHFA